MKDLYITIYTKEHGKQEFTWEDWMTSDVGDRTYHRKDGPAIIYYGDRTKIWYIDGYRHREGGPALIYSDGVKSWYLYGKEYKEKEYWEALKILNNRSNILKLIGD